MAVLLTVIKHHCEFDTAIWVHENVVGFDAGILKTHCSAKWVIVDIKIRPEDTAWTHTYIYIYINGERLHPDGTRTLNNRD